MISDTFDNGGIKTPPRVISEEIVFDCDSGYVFNPKMCFIRKTVARDMEKRGLRKGHYEPCCYCPIIKEYVKLHPELEKTVDVSKNEVLRRKAEYDFLHFDISQVPNNESEDNVPMKKVSKKKEEKKVTVINTVSAKPKKSKGKKTVEETKLINLDESKYDVRPEIKKEDGIETNKNIIKTILGFQVESIKVKREQLKMELKMLENIIDGYEKLLN